MKFEKKIVWISDYPFRGSSFGNVTYELLTRIPEYKFEVLSLGYDGLPLKINENIRVFSLSKTYQLRYYAKKFNPDLTVIFHSFWLLESMSEELPLLGGRKILYIPVEGNEVPYQYRSLFYNFEKILTPSNFSRKSLKRSGIEAKVVPHGVDLEFFNVSEERLWHEFRFGYLGMNDVRKQIPRVMEAYARLKEGILALATEAEGHYNLPMLAKQYNISPVFIEQKLNNLKMSREAVRDFLRTLDAYISPASESFGLPALEAQACGVPTIALDHGASREVLGNGAIYVNVADYLETSVGKIGLISIPDLYRKMRFLVQVKNAHKKLREKALENAKRWPWENAVKILKKELEDV